MKRTFCWVQKVDKCTKFIQESAFNVDALWLFIGPRMAFQISSVLCTQSIMVPIKELSAQAFKHSVLREMKGQQNNIIKEQLSFHQVKRHVFLVTHESSE